MSWIQDDSSMRMCFESYVCPLYTSPPSVCLVLLEDPSTVLLRRQIRVGSTIRHLLLLSKDYPVRVQLVNKTDVKRTNTYIQTKTGRVLRHSRV